MATNVYKSESNAKRGCQLCRSIKSSDAVNHRIFNCTKFNSPVSKLNKIKDLDGCVRCGLLNHTISGCNYKFSSKCGNCNSWHAFFLCEKNSNNVGQKPEKGRSDKACEDYKYCGRSCEGKSWDKKPEKRELNKSSYNKKNKMKGRTENAFHGETHSINYTVMNAQVNNNIIVPTFSISFVRNSRKHGNKKLNIRALYDPASQVTFIASHLVDKIEHKVVKDNVQIKITGFNESRDHITKIIECKLNIMSEVRLFQAVVVPEIKSKIPIAALQGISARFASNSIPLADKDILRGNDGKIGILLGVDFAHILPVQSCSFGGKTKSLIYHTGLGVMLAGNVEILNQNIHHLNSVKQFVEQIRRNK